MQEKEIQNPGSSSEKGLPTEVPPVGIFMEDPPKDSSSETLIVFPQPIDDNL